MKNRYHLFVAVLTSLLATASFGETNRCGDELSEYASQVTLTRSAHRPDGVVQLRIGAPEIINEKTFVHLFLSKGAFWAPLRAIRSDGSVSAVIVDVDIDIVNYDLLFQYGEGRCRVELRIPVTI
ncbi:MAG: hypothetical protein ACI9JM_001578 [Halioglobus sp.]|jgi:hypothetical protein